MINSIKGLLVVAHPDDCVIFGWPIIKKYSGIEWRILYMTYDKEQPRGKEVEAFWEEEGIPVDFCGVIDNHIDLDRGTIVSFNKDQVEEKILHLSRGFDLVVTHGEHGEYGHPHHVFVHRVVSQIDVPKVYFSSGDHSNLYIDGKTLGRQDLSKLKLHREVIEGFTHRYDGFYRCDDSAMDILNQQ